MIQAFITTATDEVPKMFETGWDWWAWPIAWAVLALAALILGAVAPLFALAAGAGTWRVPAITGVVLLIIAAAVTACAAPRFMMRHMDNGEGAFWVAMGSILVGLLAWGVSAHIHEYPSQDYETRQWMRWVVAVPAIVLGGAAVFGGVAEAVTRLAASIPMPVAQFLTLLVLGVVGVGVYMAAPRQVR